VLLVDTTGELKNFYACATVIFVGKSLTSHGGQNVIEPAVFRKSIVVGPNMENFPAIMEDFLAADAIRQVRDAVELKATIRALLADENERNTLGARAGRLLEEKAGAVDKTLAHVLPLIRPAS
jgi:3-deoxy-D-manno-octulosonic-acid transferase